MSIVKVIIETERLFLREMTDEDHDALYAVLADGDIMRHYPYTFDEARVRGWIRRNKERYACDGFGLWAVCLKETGEMIGDCGLTIQTIEGEKLPEIGYHILKGRQRRGYAKEAASAVMDWAFVNTAFDALYSYCKFTNVPSYRTAEAIGMRFLKEYPDDVNGITHVSAITREQWRDMRNRTVSVAVADSSNFNAASLDTFDRSQSVANVYRVIDGALRLKYDPFTETWSPERRREKAAEIMSGKYLTYCAFDNGCVIGEIMLVPQLDDGRMIVESFHVSREYRRRGIGRMLFEAAISEARGRGARAMYISACSAEETIRFYTALGCRLSEDPIPGYAEDEPYDLQMERAL